MNSDRIVFRTWEMSDLERATMLWGNPQVMAFIGKGGLSRQQVEAKLESEISCQARYGVQYWPIYQKSDEAFIGCCGLKPWIHSSKGGLELGFHLVPTAWGKGFAQEAARAVIAYAKDRKTPHLMAGHHPENQNSKNILGKLGFQFIENVFFAPTGLMHPSYILPLQ